MAAVSQSRRFGLTAQVIALVSTLLLAMNVVLGHALATQSMNATKKLLQQRMLDVSNTAAAMLDGDELKRLTADDVNTKEYQDTLHTLRFFLDNIDLEYIYGIQQLDDGTFAFTIDPEPDNPGVFGEPVVYTEALAKAATGIAAVDEEPYVDEWGEFYSAYTPVFDSEGNVAGIVGVDFAASWFDEQIMAQMRTAIIVGVSSLVVGALVVLVIMSRYRHRFTKVYRELESLADDVENLTTEVMSSPGTKVEDVVQSSESDLLVDGTHTSDIDAMGQKIRLMQAELRTHIERIQQQAYSDALTGVGNKAAYVEVINRLSDEIDKGTAAFIVAVFDINRLKQVNDTHGHDEGDRVIIDAASALTQTFGRSCAFRVGGDEFIVIIEHTTPEEMASHLSAFEDALSVINQRPDRELLPVSVSKGWCSYQPDTTKDYQSVFRLADEAMYDDKALYYQTHTDRRRQ